MSGFGQVRTAVGHIWATAGLRGLYAGFSTTIAREIPFSALQLALYETGKQVFAQRYSSREADGPAVPSWAIGILGAVSGGIAAAVTTPLDVAKTRLMTQPLGGSRAEAALPYRGVWATLVRVQHEEGTRALFAGVQPRVAWISLGGALFFGAYETAKRELSAYVWDRDP